MSDEDRVLPRYCSATNISSLNSLRSCRLRYCWIFVPESSDAAGYTPVLAVSEAAGTCPVSSCIAETGSKPFGTAETCSIPVCIPETRILPVGVTVILPLSAGIDAMFPPSIDAVIEAVPSALTGSACSQ